MTTVAASEAAIGARVSRTRAIHIVMRGGERCIARNMLRRVEPVVVYMASIATWYTERSKQKQQIVF